MNTLFCRIKKYAAMIALPVLAGCMILKGNTNLYEGWEADPERIQYLKVDRPNFNWVESEIEPYELPDPMVTLNGDVVRSLRDWEERRMEILELFRNYMFGRSPDRPEELSFELITEDKYAMDGAATRRQINIVSSHQNRTHNFEILYFLPNNVQESVPVFLFINNRAISNTDPSREVVSEFWPAEEVVGRGYGIAVLQNRDLAPDNAEHFQEGVISLFEGEIAAEERKPDAWAALAAWGWGASRVMDYFETQSGIDESRVALLGHSRGGKASLWAGAEDERFSVVISNNSGSGGAALSRRRFGETITAVNRFTYWFAENFKSFNDREDELPFDQHMLISLIAPRAVYVASADQDLWADPRGEFLSLAHSSPVYKLWGYRSITPEQMPMLNDPLVVGPRGYHIREGGHNLTSKDWNYFMDFTDRIWK